jgi:hypothetical protein
MNILAPHGFRRAWFVLKPLARDPPFFLFIYIFFYFVDGMQASFSSAPGLRSSSIGRGLSPRHAHARFVSFSSRSLRFLAATPFFNHFFSRQLPASASCRPDDLHSKKQSRLPLRCCCPRLDSGHRAAVANGRSWPPRRCCSSDSGCLSCARRNVSVHGYFSFAYLCLCGLDQLRSSCPFFVLLNYSLFHFEIRVPTVAGWGEMVGSWQSTG